MSMSLFIVYLGQVAKCGSPSADPNHEMFRHWSKRSILVLQNYANFQISNGKTGDCAARAAAVFLAPYKLDRPDLNPAGFGAKGKIRLPIDRTDLNVCNSMTRAASKAEQNFNDAISRNLGNSVLARQLQNGKICNKVLKLTGSVLCLQMEVELSQGTSDRVQKLLSQIQKLNKDIAIDKRNANQIQRSFLTF